MQEPVYVLHLITCHGRIMPHLAELLLLYSYKYFASFPLVFCLKMGFYELKYHRGVRLILAYSWTRPAMLVAGKGRGGCFY